MYGKRLRTRQIEVRRTVIVPGKASRLVEVERREGPVTYLRDAWVADKKRDYLINENSDRFGGETHKI